MKKVFVLLFATAALAACKQNPKTSTEAGQAAQASDSAATYTVDATASSIGWEASKVSATHHGKITLKEGSIAVEGGNIKAGKFTIDMTSMTNEDLDEKSKAKFLGHIKSGDFFMVDSFPTATFEIISATPEAGANGATHKIAGNLTIKGIARKVEFPATVTISGDQLTAAAKKIPVNRNEWGIIWGGKEDKNLMNNMRDDVISNVFYLDVNLVAKK